MAVGAPYLWKTYTYPSHAEPFVGMRRRLQQSPSDYVRGVPRNIEDRANEFSSEGETGRMRANMCTFESRATAEPGTLIRTNIVDAESQRKQAEYQLLVRYLD